MFSAKILKFLKRMELVEINYTEILFSPIFLFSLLHNKLLFFIFDFQLERYMSNLHNKKNGENFYAVGN